MKFNFQFLAFAILSFCLIFTSCKKDEDGETLAGSWKATSLTTSGCTDPMGNITLNFDENGVSCDTDPSTGAEFCVEQGIVYTDTNYTLSISITVGGFPFQSDTTTGTYTLDNGEITMVDQDGVETTGTYELVGDQLTVVLPPDPTSGCSTTTVAVRQ